MAEPQLFIVVDDSRSDSFVFGPIPWTTTTLPEWFNGTSQSSDFALQNTSQLGTMQMKFEGTSVAFFGVTPSVSGDSQTFAVSIDGSAPYNTTYSDPNPPTYRQWYQTPLLAEGTHNIALSNIAGASVDFAVVTVGENTSLTGQHVIADNDDPGFTYDGKWKRSQAEFNSGPQPDGNPYHNTTHQTNDIGDLFTYRFSGSSAAIYGIFTWSNLGLITLSFTLDGQSLSQTYRVNADSPQFVSELGQQQNFLFYSYDFLQSGDHTLVVNLTDCANQTFAFDYITFTPSFSTLATMPNLTLALPISNGTGQPLAKKSHTAAIVGGIAGVIILLLFGGLIFVFRRRRRGKGRYKPVYPFQHQRPETTVIPLSAQISPPLTASMYDDNPTMGLMQSAAATEHGFFNPDRTEDIFTPNRVVRPLPLFSPAATQNSSSDETSRSGEATSTTAFRGTRGRFSQWGGSDTETSPPSYDETTRGRLPPPITYVIQR